MGLEDVRRCAASGRSASFATTTAPCEPCPPSSLQHTGASDTYVSLAHALKRVSSRCPALGPPCSTQEHRTREHHLLARSKSGVTVSALLCRVLAHLHCNSAGLERPVGQPLNCRACCCAKALHIGSYPTSYAGKSAYLKRWPLTSWPLLVCLGCLAQVLHPEALTASC